MKRQPTAAVLVLCVLATLATAAPGQINSPRRSDEGASVNDLHNTHADNRLPENGVDFHQYGILGPVGQPAVYVTDRDDLTLAELVAAAGGMTQESSRLAQVIRGGHSGLQLVYSPTSSDRLIPGDVVVFDRSPPPLSGPTSKMVGVAFVGILPGEPVVISLEEPLTRLPQVIAALHQPPSIINSVRVIRTSRSAPRIPAGHLPAMLVEGDVVVFEPATINHAALAEAEGFPPPVLITDLPDTVSVEPIAPAALPVIEARDAAPSDQTQTTLALSTDPSSATSEPARGFDQAALPPLKFPDTLSPLPGSNRTHSTEPAEAGPEVNPEAMVDEGVVTTSLIDDSSSQVSPSLSGSLQSDAAVPTDVHSPFTGVAETDRATSSDSTPFDFAANSFERLALLSPAESTTSESGSEIRLAEVPVPIDPPSEIAPRGFGSRATTLGLTVLATAMICFIASLLWSRLDDSTGLTRTGQAADVEEPPLHTSTSRHGTLDRLIANSLPIIEEPSLLPEHTNYHGEAVGRRRLRIDAHHELTGPHVRGGARQASEPEAVAAKTATDSPQPNRADHPADAHADDARNEGPPSGGSIKQGGLLDRVLVAMEREKRQ